MKLASPYVIVVTPPNNGHRMVRWGAERMRIATDNALQSDEDARLAARTIVTRHGSLHQHYDCEMIYAGMECSTGNRVYFLKG